MGSTKGKRVWHSGPPPHVGWWEAAFEGLHTGYWGWFDGTGWSRFAHESKSAEYAAEQAEHPGGEYVPMRIEWSDYWPKNARVPRIDPRA